jgi:cysteine/glycine-rich protein
MSAPRCPRCNDRVYHAEETLAIGQSWHQKCFSCKTCKRKLDSGNLCDKDGEIFCKPCYGRAFGPKGYGFGGGAGSLATFGADTIVPVAGDAAPVSAPTKWCNSCDKAGEGRFCGDCGEQLVDRSELVEAKLDGVDNNRSRFEQAAAEAEEEAAAPVRPAVKHSVPKQALPAALAPKGKFGGGTKCVRCAKTVYDAEKSTGPNGAYHNACFTCLSCGKTLSAITLADREGEIYCKACYGREFGPKGYGYGVGAGALGNTGQ